VFDILAYLVERYYELGPYPDQDTLSRQLAAAGFESQEIQRALRWLSGLALDQPPHAGTAAGSDGPVPLRHYTPAEQYKLDVESRGFLQFLEAAGALDAKQRELVLDRVMALSDIEIGLDELKLVVLLVLWNQGRALDSLILDELLVTERVVTLH
jgi:Smg protein